jgi:hypothetical protein
MVAVSCPHAHEAVQVFIVVSSIIFVSPSDFSVPARVSTLPVMVVAIGEFVVPLCVSALAPNNNAVVSSRNTENLLIIFISVMV